MLHSTIPPELAIDAALARVRTALTRRIIVIVGGCHALLFVLLKLTE